MISPGGRIFAWLNRLSKTRSRQGLYEFLMDEYGKIPAGARVLNVGSGGDTGRMLSDHARSRGFTSLSIDIDDEKKPDVLGDICAHDFGAHAFDVVVMSEVLEHVHSPKDALSNVHRALTPGGKLILSTPFILPIHESPRDFFRFTRHGLSLLLSEYRDVRISERNSYFEAIDVLWLRLLHTNLRSAGWASVVLIPLIYFLKRPLTLLLGKLIRTNAMTTGYVVVAVK